MMTLRPTVDVSVAVHPRAGAADRGRTLRSECHADRVGEDVDALEDARATVVGELDLRVRTALECRLRNLGRHVADSGR